ncbi:MAG: glycoside hydrolase family 2 protein [Ruminococcaceae bacterium]|nr:glycoside hydrolase family 2 protein [Oscillospiraceae bacterium]
MRNVQTLKRDWKFRFFTSAEAAEACCFTPDYNDSGWETVRVPHDWAAKGEFDEDNDASYSKIVADGITKERKHTGRSGALPTVGFGVYRRILRIAEEERGRKIYLEFDGVMWGSAIYINGEKAGSNHFGYRSFEVDITPFIRFGEDNLLAVGVEMLPDCSRWYSGAGIFRNVRLISKNEQHIAYNGVWVRQLEANAKNAAFLIEIDHTGDETVRFRADIFTPSGELMKTAEHGVYAGELSDIFTIPSPVLWDIDHPALYTADVTLLSTDDTVLDGVTVRFGVRNIRFSAEEGFFLNGRHVKLNGVCNHHDLGSLGAAVSVPALRRQLQLMRGMGVNAIRTSHNPPAPELLDLCDEMGFVVMDEFFDEWRVRKVKNGYAQYFDDHAADDVIGVIRRDRNHPCVILWSIGNEIGEQSQPEGWRTAKFLTDLVHRTDPTRPTSAGLDRYPAMLDNHLIHFVDVPGLNYKPHFYKKTHEEHPDFILLGSETESCVSTRGVYHLPAQVEIPAPVREDLTVSAYDLSAPGWAYYPERELAAQADCPFIAGEFIWTGMDYMGEPTPYYSEWPSRSSYFGVVDLAGLPKNRYYAYRAVWTDNPVLHVFPHWNWEGMEGQVVPVHVYTSYPEAELFINGKSCGRRTFGTEDEIQRFRLMWNDVVYEPGEVKVIAYDTDGNAAAETAVRTAGEPHHITLEAERSEIAADGEDLVYVIARVMDAEGNICPKADNRITFAVEGAGEFLTTDAGDQREVESFARPDKKALAGHLVACIRALEEAGTIRIRASADGLISAEAEVLAK